MSERRVDPFTGRGVVLVPARRALVRAASGGLPSIEGRCPFCPGHEADTERTLAAWPPEGPWQVRVVANKYPVTEHHEVGIDAREHDSDLADLGAAHASAMLRVYRDRVAALEATRGIEAVLLFRNRGRGAGSSQPHPHTQIVGLDWIPAEIALRAQLARDHRAAHGESLHAALLREELEAGVRVLRETPHAVLLCPRAPSASYEMRIMVRAEQRFATMSGDACASVADLLVDAHARLRSLGFGDANFIVRQAAADEGWHVDILPRLGHGAGFELATGERIVVIPPEDAAAELRAAG